MNLTDNATAANRPVIDPSLIPWCVRKDIGRVGLMAVIKYYMDPENERRFQIWAAMCRKRQAEERTKGGPE